MGTQLLVGVAIVAMLLLIARIAPASSRASRVTSRPLGPASGPTPLKVWGVAEQCEVYERVSELVGPRNSLMAARIADGLRGLDEEPGNPQHALLLLTTAERVLGDIKGEDPEGELDTLMGIAVLEQYFGFDRRPEFVAWVTTRPCALTELLGEWLQRSAA